MPLKVSKAGGGGVSPSLLIGQTLPAKDAALFRQILQLYEAKAYKKALKIADGLLKKHPNHGETTCMKALLLLSRPSSTPDGAVKREAFELVKAGVSYNVKSHVSWHVYGLMHRADHNYPEACKCYAQALKIEPENWGIMRDYATLLAQTRNFPTLEKIRLQLISTGPTVRANWAALAVSQELNGDKKAAASSCADYVRQVELKDIQGEHRYPYSEFLVYWSELILDSEGPEAFIKHLDHPHVKDGVFDKQALHELQAKACLQIALTKDQEEEWAEAKRLARELVDLNPDNRERLLLYLSASKCDMSIAKTQGSTEALEILDQISQSHPRADCPKRLAIELSQSNEFQRRLTDYFVNAISKGIPSLFKSLRSICGNDRERMEILGRVAEKYENKMDDSNSPNDWPWIWSFLAHYHLYLSSRGIEYGMKPQDSLERASSWIEKAIKHSPTLPELYFLQARILKKSGDMEGSAQTLCLARDLDLQDRYINSRCAKALFRIGSIEEAEAILGSFGKKESTTPSEVSPMADLIEMQATWALSEEALAFEMTGQYRMALKRYSQLKKIFEDWREDEHDFHSYCTRRSTLRAYIGSLKFGDQLPSLPIFQRDAKRAIEFLIFAHDQRKEKEVKVNGHSQEGHVEETTKESAPISKKDAKKAKKEAMSKASAPTPQTNGKSKSKTQNDDDEEEEVEAPDEDPTGEKAYSQGDFLATAERWIMSLNDGASKCLQTHLLSFEVYLRSKKYMLAIKALRLSRELDLGCAKVESQLARLRDAVFGPDLGMPDILKSAAQKQVLALYQVQEAEDLPKLEQQASELVQRNAGSTSHLLAAVEILNLVDKKAAVDLISIQYKQQSYAHDRTFENAKRALDLLRSVTTEKAEVEDYKKTCLTWYPHAQLFGGPSVQTTGLGSLEQSKPGFGD